MPSSDSSEPTEPEKAPVLEGARYAYFEAVLDCGVCGNELRVEGDVSNGEVIECDSCGEKLEVYNR